MTRVLLSAYRFVWGAPTLLLIFWVGVWISLKTGFVQFRLFPAALRVFVKTFCRRKESGGVSPFRALCTALGATVGTGNIIGVAGAICLGGPGAVFWMLLCGVLSMGIKFAEAVLAVRYREMTDDAFVGGPMYIISNGMGDRWRGLAVCYCIFGLMASFGVGNIVQINAVISGINNVLLHKGIEASLQRSFAIGLILSVVVGSILLGGSGRIGAAAEMLVPVVSLFYIGMCVGVLAIRWQLLPNAVGMIIRGAFHPEAVTGGVIGSAFQAVRVGCSRGIFTNEAGMGTASMAHAGAEVSHPAEQGLMGIVEVFLDTIVLCTLTALVILVSGVPVPYGTDGGGSLAVAAFSGVCGSWSAVALAVALCCFAFATILGWGLYGVRCAQFLFGSGAWKMYAAVQTGMVCFGTLLNTESIWLLSELFNGLMAVPNLIVLAALTPELSRLTKEYINKSGGTAAVGGNHADFHQCKPL